MLEGFKIDILSCHDTITLPIDIDSFFRIFIPFISKESFVFVIIYIEGNSPVVIFKHESKKEGICPLS